MQSLFFFFLAALSKAAEDQREFIICFRKSESRESRKGQARLCGGAKKQRSAFPGGWEEEEGARSKKKKLVGELSRAAAAAKHSATSRAFAAQCAGFLAPFSRSSQLCIDLSTRVCPRRGREERKREPKGRKRAAKEGAFFSRVSISLSLSLSLSAFRALADKKRRKAKNSPAAPSTSRRPCPPP